jgi:hypothetical protein
LTPERAVSTEIAQEQARDAEYEQPERQRVPGAAASKLSDAYRGRQLLNADTIREMHAAFRVGGRAAIDKVMKNQPAIFLKLLVLLVPRELQIEHRGGVKGMTEDQIVDAIDSSYFLFIAHPPVIIAVQALLKDVSLPPLVKLALVFISTLLVLMPLYHYCVRATFIGVALNGRIRPPSPAGSPLSALRVA